MKFTTAALAVLLCCAACSAASAISFGGPGGKWPQNWPQELEPYRKQAWTWEHGFGGFSFDIPFDSRENFESVWPTILELKGRGAPITLMRGPHVRVRHGRNAGVRIVLPRDMTLEDAAKLFANSGDEAAPSPAQKESPSSPAANEPPATEAGRGAADHNPPAAQRKARSKSADAQHEVSLMLIVDGEIVDLNRIALPAGTPIIDRRFKAASSAAKK